MKVRGVILAAVCVTTGLLATGRAEAQQMIALEIPGVQGEIVTPPTLANQIEVLSVSLGASKPCGSGSLSLSEVAIMKNTDKASVDLSVALRDHTVYPTATLRFARSDNGIYQVYQLTNAVVTSIQMSGSGGAPRSQESVTFSFSQMVVTYTFFDSNGKPGSPESMTYTAASCP